MPIEGFEYNGPTATPKDLFQFVAVTENGTHLDLRTGTHRAIRFFDSPRDVLQTRFVATVFQLSGPLDQQCGMSLRKMSSVRFDLVSR